MDKFPICYIDDRICAKYDHIHIETPISLNVVPEELVFYIMLASVLFLLFGVNLILTSLL